MGHVLGMFERIDWDGNLPRNIRFMYIRVRVDPWLPLMVGFMLRLDNGDRVWIQCRYERIHKLCTKCGLIGHSRAQCTYLIEDVEQFLHRQHQRIQHQFQLHYDFDPLEPHFVNEMRAFYNRPLRRNIQVCFGPLHRDTGYWHRQHQQGGAPPPNLADFLGEQTPYNHHDNTQNPNHIDIPTTHPLAPDHPITLDSPFPT